MSNSPTNDDAAQARLATAHAADAATHGDHDGHDDVTAEEPPEAPRQIPLALYIAPIIIFLLVLIFIWRPVSDAFSKYQQQPAEHSGLVTPGSGEASAATSGDLASATPALEAMLPAAPTNTVAQFTATTAPATATSIPPTDTAVAPTDTAVPPTDTAVAPTETAAPSPSATALGGLPANYGDTTNGALRSIAINGATFRVEASALVPDWVFSNENGVASWVDGTVINYLVGLPQSDANQALFAALKPGDRAALTLASGDIYNFVIDKTSRVNKNDTSVLAQDHPALTMLLLGAPGEDRAVAQGHYVE